MGEMRMPTVGAGFHARPAWVKGKRRMPVKMVRGLCPRDMICWAADITVRAVGNAVAGGHAKRPQPVNRGGHATSGRA